MLIPLSVLQHKRVCRRLLKHLQLIDNGEVEVDSLLIYHSHLIYKCSAVSCHNTFPQVIDSSLQSSHTE